MPQEIDVAGVTARHQEIVDRYGPWTAHNIQLGHGLSTMAGRHSQQWRVDWFGALIHRFQGERGRRRHGLLGWLAARLARPSFTGLKILDLACLEGLFAIEFARMGARTTGIEIREAHLAKAEFARETLGLAECRFIKGDVRTMPEGLDGFDVILCAGILYHLDFPDCIRFLRDLTRRSTDLIILDSHYAYGHIETSVLPLSAMRSYEFEGRRYRGRAIVEHATGLSEQEKAEVHVWAWINNDVSVWLDEGDVVALMRDHGFELALKAYPNASYRRDNPDRPTLVFKKR